MLARWPERAGVVWLVVALFLMVLGLAKGIYPLLDVVVERADTPFVSAALPDTPIWTLVSQQPADTLHAKTARAHESSVSLLLFLDQFGARADVSRAPKHHRE